MNQKRSPDSWVRRLRHSLCGEPRDREQLVEVLRDAERRGLIDPETLAMTEGVLTVSRLRVREIMIPRPQMVVAIKGQSLNEFLPEVVESAHSRLPVMNEDQSEVLGILLAKDLLAYCDRGDGEQRFSLHDAMRPATVVPESKRLDAMLRTFRSSRNHMAIVVDEYGEVSGLVTIEDVLEQIVGDITDEHDVDDVQVLSHGQGEYTVKGSTPVEDFTEATGSRLDDQEADTVAGLVLNAFGRVPEQGEEVAVGPFLFCVLRADKRRIHLLRATRTTPAAGTP